MIRIVGPRVLVLLPPNETETMTASGIVLVKDPELRTKTRGIVVAVGRKTGQVSVEKVCALIQDECQQPRKAAEVIAAVRKLQPPPFDVRVEDVVIFPVAAGDRIDLDGHSYVIVDETDILGILEPLAKGAAA